MAQFKAQMARHESPELKKIIPELQVMNAVSKQMMRHEIFGCKKGSSHFEKRARAS